MSLSLSSRAETTMVLSLYLNSKLEQYFPNDPYSDINILMVKTYKLQKAYLRLESDFFAENFEIEMNKTMLIINKKFESPLFEKILRCFYGGRAVIHQNEIYAAFEICHYLKSSNLVAQMVEQLVKNFETLNFFMVYSIGFLYLNDELLEKCFTFLRETNFKAMMEEWVYASKPNNKFPNTIYSLSEDSFKNLIKMHNQLKINSTRGTGFLSFTEIYNIIKTYVTNNNAKPEQTIKLKDMVIELIDRNQLSSKEYKIIYHQDLFLIDDEKSINLDTKNDVGAKFVKPNEKLDLITSENFLFRKEMEELRNDNSVLLCELKVLKENFQKSQSSLAAYDEKYNDLLKRFKDVKTEIVNNQLKSEMRFYQLELIVEELRTEAGKTHNGDNFYRTFSEKIGNCSKLQRKSEKFPVPPLNRRSTEETKASRNDLGTIPNKEERMRMLLKNTKTAPVQPHTDFTKHSLSAEFQITKKHPDHVETPLAIPTYSILKRKGNDTPPTADDIMRKIEGFNKPHEQNDYRLNNIMQNICLEQNPEDATHESFFFLDRNQALNNTMLSNYSQIINPALLTAQFNYETNYKNTVLMDVKSQFVFNDSDFKTLKKWFDVKLYQKLKLHLIFRGSRDTFKTAILTEKKEGITPILVFFSAKEMENEVFGGFLSEHSDQGFAFDLRKQIRIEFTSNKEEEKGFLLCLGRVARIYEDGDKEKKNVLLGELRDIPEEKEISFTLREMEMFQVLIDSEMEI